MIIGAYGYWRVRRWRFCNLAFVGADHNFQFDMSASTGFEYLLKINCKVAIPTSRVPPFVAKVIATTAKPKT